MTVLSQATPIGSATLEVAEGPDGFLALTFKGNIDLADPTEVMDPALNRLHEHVLQDGLPGVVADFTQLQFFNSSGIKALITWVIQPLALLVPE